MSNSCGAHALRACASRRRKIFEEIGKPVAAGTFISAPEMTPELEKELKKLADKCDQKLYPPNYLDNIS